MAKRPSSRNGELFIDDSGQLRMLDKSVEQHALEARRVECLGITFASEEERQLFFAKSLKEKLAEPDFRATPGFPKGTDEDILAMSDPPFYTACPNPFLADFITTYGKTYDARQNYVREPFAVDTSIGKTDAVYKAHSYHTKVPHLAIVPFLLHYTEPGDIVYDGFAGSGMTGVAALWCGSPSQTFKRALEAEWTEAGLGRPRWGVRRAILNDLGPAASHIAATYTLPFDVREFCRVAEEILSEIEREVGWAFKAMHTDGTMNGSVNYTVWSESFVCPDCTHEQLFFDAAFVAKTGELREELQCLHCGSKNLNSRTLEPLVETYMDRQLGRLLKRVRRTPVLVNYSVGKKTFERRPTDQDVELIRRCESFPPAVLPLDALPDMQMARVGRMRTTHTTHVHQFFLPRIALVLSLLWQRIERENDARVRRALVSWVDGQFRNLSILNRYRPNVSFPYNPLSGVFYVAALVSEADPFRALRNKLKRLTSAFEGYSPTDQAIAVSTGHCGASGLPDNSIDYVFTDPPFGENIYYSDLNFLHEAWHRVYTDASPEAIVDRAKGKTVSAYQSLMRDCISEYARVLKPGRWMTLVFSNSSNAVWRAIQEALGTSGFVVADVRMLDKVQGSFKQVTSSAVKQDLVISAYKPTDALIERFRLGASSTEDAWAFVSEHLRHVPVFVESNGQAEIVIERTAQMLHDRVVSFHVQRSLAIPLSTGEFLAGLAQRYPERDGMYFLSDQVGEYDRKRTKTTDLRQLSLFVTDEASAIQWVRQQLAFKPQSFQDLQPAFMRELQGWAKHESTVELKVILEQCFLRYDGRGPVPSQIHAYLSTNFKDLRNLAKDDSVLVSKARDRWYVPDPGKQADLEKVRERNLVKEFSAYVESRERKLKQFRTEAVRAGFKTAYDSGDYKTIVAVASKLPDAVLQEDEKLLMYYDVASMRLGAE